MERKKRSKGSVWEFCYANKIVGTFEEEMKAYGEKWVTFCTHTHAHAAKLVVRMHRLLFLMGALNPAAGLSDTNGSPLNIT